MEMDKVERKVAECFRGEVKEEINAPKELYSHLLAMASYEFDANTACSSVLANFLLKEIRSMFGLDGDELALFLEKVCNALGCSDYVTSEMDNFLGVVNHEQRLQFFPLIGDEPLSTQFIAWLDETLKRSRQKWELRNVKDFQLLLKEFCAQSLPRVHLAPRAML